MKNRPQDKRAISIEETYYTIKLDIVNDIKSVVEYNVTEVVFQKAGDTLRVTSEDIYNTFLNYAGDCTGLEFTFIADSKHQILTDLCMGDDAGIQEEDVYVSVFIELISKKFFIKKKILEIKLILEIENGKYNLKVAHANID